MASRTTRSSLRCSRERGSIGVDVDTVEFALHIDDGDELWDGLIQGSVRVAPLILGQSEAVQREIREHYDALLEAYRTQDGFDVPVSFKLAAGAKA